MARKLGTIFLRVAYLLIVCTKVCCTWWSISQLPIQAALSGAEYICDHIPGLVTKQRKICRRYPDVMESIREGARAGITECQDQFSTNRWNCTTFDRDSTVFGKSMLRGSREAAFVYAISSAGVMNSITRACSKGKIRSCSCDPTKTGTGKDKKGLFQWGGCSHHIRYGSQFARMFVDAREKRGRDARALMNLHNNRAGRRAVRKHLELRCKCHGVSGSCAVRTCWLAMQDFSKVGAYLRKKYDGATLVMMNQEATNIIVANRYHKKPTRSDLVYLEKSPDFCVKTPETGSLGTSGRQCNATSMGTDGCDIMCCGRGYNTRTVLQVRKCRCEFKWCCDVECKTCEEWINIHTCKGHDEVSTTTSTRKQRLQRRRNRG